MEIENRLLLFQEMIRCCHNLFFWTYDEALQPLYSNCPDEIVVNNLFALASHHESLLTFAENHHKPIIMTNELSLMWIAVPEKHEDELNKIHILGPFFIDNISTRNIEAKLTSLKLTPALFQEAVRFLRELPVISLSRVFEYAIMLYYCVCGERITASDLHYQENEQLRSKAFTQPEVAETHGTYDAEQKMLRMVREGNLNYKAHMSKMSMTGNLGKLSNDTPLRQMKNAVLVAITLFSRAAIDGGLSPEISMTLTDRYFQSVEACSAITDLVEISHTMQEDFVQRVHQCRNNAISKTVQICCDYIGLHIEDDLSLQKLAQQLNYSDYYLSKKFKRETGMTINDYIRLQRLESAKILLSTTTLNIQDITEKLHFCSQSYFAEAFRTAVGVSPTAWRNMPR